MGIYTIEQSKDWDEKSSRLPQIGGAVVCNLRNVDLDLFSYTELPTDSEAVKKYKNYLKDIMEKGVEYGLATIQDGKIVKERNGKAIAVTNIQHDLIYYVSMYIAKNKYNEQIIQAIRNVTEYGEVKGEGAVNFIPTIKLNLADVANVILKHSYSRDQAKILREFVEAEKIYQSITLTLPQTKEKKEKHQAKPKLVKLVKLWGIQEITTAKVDHLDDEELKEYIQQNQTIELVPSTLFYSNLETNFCIVSPKYWDWKNKNDVDQALHDYFIGEFRERTNKAIHERGNTIESKEQRINTIYKGSILLDHIATLCLTDYNSHREKKKRFREYVKKAMDYLKNSIQIVEDYTIQKESKKDVLYYTINRNYKQVVEKLINEPEGTTKTSIE